MLYVVEFAVVFNFILLVILIRFFCAIIPQPIVDTSFSIITREISLQANSGNWINYNFLFVYVLLFDDVSRTRNAKISMVGLLGFMAYQAF